MHVYKKLNHYMLNTTTPPLKEADHGDIAQQLSQATYCITKKVPRKYYMLSLFQAGQWNIIGIWFA